MLLMLRRWVVRVLPLTLVMSAMTTGVVGVPGSSHAVFADHVVRMRSAGPSLRDVRVGRPIDLVGFSWERGGPATIQVRGRAGGGWRGWTTIASDTSTGPDSPVRRGPMTAGPVWLGRGVTRIQFRVVSGRVSALQVHAIRSSNAGTSSTVMSADAATRQPWFITRSKWGADESWRGVAPGCPPGPVYADTVHEIVIHDTATSNDYKPADSASIVRAIYFFHTKVNEWCDIGYNFLVDKFGQIFEGRFGGINRPVVGAHAGGFNVGSSGIGLIGDYDTDNPPKAMYTGVRVLSSWLASTYRIRARQSVQATTGDFPDANWPPRTPVTIPALGGHRDLDKTDCPGDKAYAALGRLRTDVARATGLW